MQRPIQLFPASVVPTCAAVMNTTRCSGLRGVSASMIPRVQGVRLVRQGPASEAGRDDSTRCRSARCDTVSAGSGASPASGARGRPATRGPDAGRPALLASPRVRHRPWTRGGTMANWWNRMSGGLPQT